MVSRLHCTDGCGSCVVWSVSRLVPARPQVTCGSARKLAANWQLLQYSQLQPGCGLVIFMGRKCSSLGVLAVSLTDHQQTAAATEPL